MLKWDQVALKRMTKPKGKTGRKERKRLRINLSYDKILSHRACD